MLVFLVGGGEEEGLTYPQSFKQLANYNFNILPNEHLLLVN